LARRAAVRSVEEELALVRPSVLYRPRLPPEAIGHVIVSFAWPRIA